MPKRIKDRRNAQDSALSEIAAPSEIAVRPNDVQQQAAKDRRGSSRRAHERVMVDMEVDYKADETFLFAYITDISAMGIFVRTNNPEPKGTRINLRFKTPADVGGELVEVEGEVIWVNPVRTLDVEGRNPGMGVRFVDLTAPQREQVMHMVRTFAYLNEEDDEEEAKGHS